MGAGPVKWASKVENRRTGTHTARREAITAGHTQSFHSENAAVRSSTRQKLCTHYVRLQHGAYVLEKFEELRRTGTPDTFDSPSYEHAEALRPHVAKDLLYAHACLDVLVCLLL